MIREVASRLLKSRFLPPQDLRRALEAAPSRNALSSRRRRRRATTPDYQSLKGVVKGQFVRVKIPSREAPSRMPKLLNPASPPVKPFTQPPPDKAVSVALQAVVSGSSQQTPTTLHELTTATQAERKEFFHEYWDRLKAWTKHNFAVMVLNFGSVCSLVGFTRSDVRDTCVVIGSRRVFLF